MDKLEAMLKYVSEHNDFYKKRIAEYGITNPLDITQWPILTRSELQENRYQMFSDGYKTKYFNQELRRQFSSGSTGRPVNVYWDPVDYYSSNKTLWDRRFKYYNVLPINKRVLFTLRIYGKNYSDSVRYYINKTNNLMVVNVSLFDEGHVDSLLKMIDDFSPKWFYITPYTLSLLIDNYEKRSLRPPKSITYIESVGELLPNELKERAKDFFSVPIVNMYGSEEMNGIAYECPMGNMHIINENVYVECYNRGDYSSCEGEAIITSLKNKAMPLIRYNQEDVIRLTQSDDTCHCSSYSSTLAVIKGRTRERIVLTRNVDITPYSLSEIMEEVNNISGDLVTWYNYVFYKSNHLLKCYLTLRIKDWFIMIEKLIKEAFSIKLGTLCKMFTLEIVLVDSPFAYDNKMSIIHIID